MQFSLFRLRIKKENYFLLFTFFTSKFYVGIITFRNSNGTVVVEKNNYIKKKIYQSALQIFSIGYFLAITKFNFKTCTGHQNITIVYNYILVIVFIKAVNH